MLKAADVQNAKAKTRYDDTGNIQAKAGSITPKITILHSVRE